VQAPPDEVRRGGRWKVVLLVLLALVVIGVPVGLAIVAGSSDTPGAPDQETAEPEDGTEEPGEADTDAEDDLAADLDLDALSGRDEALARLLGAVDDSERAMIGFQDRVAEVFRDPAADDPEVVLDQVRSAAQDGADGLADARPALVTAVDDPRIEEVRSVYLAHHDVWADYLDAVTEEPLLLAREDEGARWTLSINASAEAFARALREELDEDLDDDVRDVAERLLARGFDRGDVRPDV
jgi:hypothetical protein